MKAYLVGAVICTAIALAHAQNEDTRPILKEPQANLVRCIEALSDGNVAAARVNVAHDAAQKRARIFAVASGECAGRFKEQGYGIESSSTATWRSRPKPARARINISTTHR
jgi:hypothetical protein